MNHSNSNTVADDICGAIGYTATALLCAWFGGRNLYVPLSMHEGHFIARLIGVSAAMRLSSAFPGDHLPIPDERWRRAADNTKRTVALLTCQGVGSGVISERTGLSRRRVDQLKQEIEKEGLLDLLKNDPVTGEGKDPL